MQLAKSMTPSSSAPESPASTSFTGSGNSGSGCGCSRPAAMSAAPGTGTAIPGARFDSESYSYGFSFSGELLQEWEWSEHFSPQPGNAALCEFRRGQIRPAPRYPLRHPDRPGGLGRGRARLGGGGGGRASRARPLAHHGGRPALHPANAADRGHGGVPGAVLSHLRLAARAAGACRQARGRHRHGRDRRAADSGGRGGRRAI